MIVLYAALCLFAYLASERMMFVPPAATYADGGDIIKLRTADGVTIAAVHLPNRSAPFTLLVSHGNAEDLGAMSAWLHQLRSIGFAVFAYDYRGYGQSGGRPSERGTYADIDAAYGHLTGELGVAPERIIAYGRSVGSGPAVDLAARRPLGGLIIESGFTTAFRVLTRVALVPFDRYRNLDKLAQVRCPVLIMHGRADDIVPWSHGEALWRRAAAPKRHLWIDGASHNDLWLVGEREIVQALRDFSAFAVSRP